MFAAMVLLIFVSIIGPGASLPYYNAILCSSGICLITDMEHDLLPRRRWHSLWCIRLHWLTNSHRMVLPRSHSVCPAFASLLIS